MYQKAFCCIKYIIAKIKVNTILEEKMGNGGFSEK